MRYYMHDGPAAFRFELAGDLEANDAARLEQDWNTASSMVGNRTLIVDLSFVTGIAESVRSLFKRWYAAGAEFAANSKRSRELVELITGRPFTQEQPHAPTYRSWVSLKFWLALLAVLAPSQVRATDDGASLAFARFVSRSTPAMAQSTDFGDMAIEIEASLPQMGKQGRLEAIRHRGPTGTPEYKVVSFEGDTTVKQQVIARYLAAEKQAYDRPAASFAVTPDNYKFRYIASIDSGSGRFYIFGIKPRHRKEGLIQGQIWIHGATGALEHQDGRLAKRPSMFIREVGILRDTGDRVVPYVRVTRIDVETRLFGHAKLTIRERPQVGQVDNLRRIVNPPGTVPENCRADCQSAAGYQPAPQK
jgi:hypothetical protein